MTQYNLTFNGAQINEAIEKARVHVVGLDTSPQQGSNKVVNSDGIYTAVTAKINTSDIVTEAQTIAANDVDTKVPSAAAVKDYVTSTKNLTVGYNQTYSSVTITKNAANQNTGSRPIVVMFNLVDNEGVKVSNDNVTYFTVYTQSGDRGPCTIIVPPGAYYKVTKSSGSITNEAIILS